MKKGHYLGGGTLSGFGEISKPKGRRGGFGTSGASIRQDQQTLQRKQKQQLAETIRSNEKVVKQLGREWAAEKGRKLYDKVIKEKRIKTSPLAAALNLALSSENGEDNG